MFDVEFADLPSVVARIAKPSERASMEGALHLSRLLRPRGVPLPEVIAEDVGAPLPWLLLERLPGVDLGEVIAALANSELKRIARRVADAQAITGQTPSAGRYGYAARPEDAPHATWSAVVAAHIERSRQRINAAGLFDPDDVALGERLLDGLRYELDSVGATPFLHDTTTKNVIVTATGAFSGIVDVDDLCFGDPRYPAALTLAALMAHGRPTAYVEAWRHYAGWQDDDLFRFYVAVFLLDLMAEHGQTFNGNEQPSSPAARVSLRAMFEATARGVKV